ncbi:hypothetical protein LICSK_02055 [Leptospira interrogans serovar Copenhageni]|nr:hypothetical protein LICSK_02055 [Leptospira interrogans serovar Copenhageni]
MDFTLLELLKNSLVPINKTASIARFHKIETDGELIFQQFYSKVRFKTFLKKLKMNINLTI